LAPNSQRQTRSDYCRQSACAKELEEQIAKTAGLAKEPGEPGWDQPKHLRVPRGIRRTVAELERSYAGSPTRYRGLCSGAFRTRRMTTTDGAPAFDGTDATLFHPRWLWRNLLAGLREGAIRRRLRHRCHEHRNFGNRLALSSLPRLERDRVFGERAKTETGRLPLDMLDFFRCQIDGEIAPFIDGNGRPWKMGQKGIANLYDQVEITLCCLRAWFIAFPLQFSCSCSERGGAS
jgi:hypothetical protein